ncbi:helix-turn-helix domain-containing protein, partial [Gracilibacillus kekensis]
MSYSHLTTFERARIETLYEQGKPIRTIAEKLQRSPSTISRELKRNSQKASYKSEYAQEKYNERRLNCGRVGKWST